MNASRNKAAHTPWLEWDKDFVEFATNCWQDSAGNLPYLLINVILQTSVCVKQHCNICVPTTFVKGETNIDF